MTDATVSKFGCLVLLTNPQSLGAAFAWDDFDVDLHALARIGHLLVRFGCVRLLFGFIRQLTEPFENAVQTFGTTSVPSVTKPAPKIGKPQRRISSPHVLNQLQLSLRMLVRMGMWTLGAIGQ